MSQSIKEIVAGGLVVILLMFGAFKAGQKTGSMPQQITKDVPANVMAGCYVDASTNGKAGFFGLHNIALCAAGTLSLTNLDFVAGGFPTPGMTNRYSATFRCKITEDEYAVLSRVIMRASGNQWLKDNVGGCSW